MKNIIELIEIINSEKFTRENVKVLKALINEKIPNGKNNQEYFYEKMCDLISIEINKNKKKDAADLLKIIYITNNHELAHEYIKSSGIFRPSKYSYNTKLLLNIINEIESILEILNIDSYKIYYKSVLNLVKISPDIKFEYNKILNTLKNKNTLRLFLIHSEYQFFLRNFKENNLNIACIEDHIKNEIFYSPEAISESVSTILKLYINHSIKGDIPQANFNTTYNFNFDIESTIRSAYIVSKFNEIEIDVTIFEYNTTINSNILTIEASEFEKRKKIGYFLAENKKYALSVEINSGLRDILNGKDLLSLDKIKELIFKLSSEDEFDFFIIKRNPDRFALKFFTPFYENFKIKNKTILKEDFIYLSIISHENYLLDDEVKTIYNIADKEIYKNLTTLDYLKLSRVFKVMNFILQSAYLKNNTTLKNCNLFLMNSLTSILSNSAFDNILKESSILNEKQNMKDILSPITIDIRKKTDFLDLQYTPILKINNYESLILTSTAFSSDLVRRICVKEEISFSIDKSTTPPTDNMIIELKKSFKNRNFLVETDFKFSNFEIDFIALKDNNLFIFECKNPYHGVNNHELRNTYNHIKKAIFQLKRIEHNLEHLNKKDQLISKLKWSNEKNNKLEIHYGILNSNRTLIGYKKSNITVYHSHQIINLLDNGKINSFGKIKSLWRNKDFQTSDLVDFLNTDINNLTPTELTEEYSLHIKLSNYTINYKSYLCGINEIRNNYFLPKDIIIKI